MYFGGPIYVNRHEVRTFTNLEKIIALQMVLQQLLDESDPRQLDNIKVLAKAVLKATK